MRMCVAAVVVVCLALGGVASADDTGFHRTTPRASLDGTTTVLVIGVPGGRAWGIESELRPLPSPATALFARVIVTDDAVHEAFVRIAYYASATQRTRQIATSDSEIVPTGRSALVSVPFEPPPGAVAYRVRVLARLVDRDARSSDDAITVRLRGVATRAFGSLFSRLLP